MTAPTTLAEHWGALATAALLGTDRRPPPAPPPGPIADVLDSLGPLDDAEATLTQVVALTAARRAGLRPAAPVATLQTAAPDGRPGCPSAAVRRLPELLQHWPMLVGEWLGLVERAGFRLPPEHLVALLRRERSDQAGRALVVRVAGPLAEWLAALFPELEAQPKASGATASGAPVPLPVDLAALVAAPPDRFVAGVVAGLESGMFANRHRALLVAVVVAVDPSYLSPLVAALDRAAPRPESVNLAHTLAALAHARAAMICELDEPVPPGAPGHRTPTDPDATKGLP